MLELNRSYTKPELTRILGTQSKQGIDRKLQRYGIGFEVCGRGENAAYTIKTMADPFKVYAIIALGFDANTDFTKLRNVYYHFFEDEVFMAMPDEVKENRLRKIGEGVSRQAIAGYIQKLEKRNMITRHTNDFIYYFAFNQEQRIVEKAEYLDAWHEYWADRDIGFDSIEAIYRMRQRYGGVARKQEIPAINGIFNQEIEYMLTLIQQSIENEIREKN